MSPFRTILAAFDFSPCAQAALAHAIRLGRGQPCDVTLLHAVQPLHHNRAWLDEESASKVPTLDQLMEEAAARLHYELPADVDATAVRQGVVAGHALGTILDWCSRERPELLVIGAHSTHDAHRHMGYVASGAIRKAAAPVLAVHAPPGSGAAGRVEPFRSILVATDFSETSAAALRQALRLARLDGAEVEVMHAFADPWPGDGPPPWHSAVVPDFAERYARRVRDGVEAWAAPILADASSVRVAFAAVKHRKPAVALAERARERGADLIALGTKGTTNLRYIFLGSTAESVLRNVPCSVLAVKPDADATDSRSTASRSLHEDTPSAP